MKLILYISVEPFAGLDGNSSVSQNITHFSLALWSDCSSLYGFICLPGYPLKGGYISSLHNIGESFILQK
jgi:hypothetical protein